MCRLSTHKIQWQQNDEAGSFRNEQLYAMNAICCIMRWYCLLEVVPADYTGTLHYTSSFFLSKPEVQFSVSQYYRADGLTFNL